jgi:hypothetical protein
VGASGGDTAPPAQGLGTRQWRNATPRLTIPGYDGSPNGVCGRHGPDIRAPRESTRWLCPADDAGTVMEWQDEGKIAVTRVIPFTGALATPPRWPHPGETYTFQPASHPAQGRHATEAQRTVSRRELPRDEEYPAGAREQRAG